AISDIPWAGPTACCVVGYQDGQYVLNPSMRDLHDGLSQLELTVAASADAVLMVEAAADELPEDVMVGAIEFAQAELAKVVGLIAEMREDVGLPKRDFAPEVGLDDALVADVAR